MTDDLTPAAAHTALAPWQELEEAVRAYARASKAPNTVRAYRSDLGDCTMWRTDHGLFPIPATPEAVRRQCEEGGASGRAGRGGVVDPLPAGAGRPIAAGDRGPARHAGTERGPVSIAEVLRWRLLGRWQRSGQARAAVHGGAGLHPCRTHRPSLCTGQIGHGGTPLAT